MGELVLPSPERFCLDSTGSAASADSKSTSQNGQDCDSRQYDQTDYQKLEASIGRIEHCTNCVSCSIFQPRGIEGNLEVRYDVDSNCQHQSNHHECDDHTDRQSLLFAMKDAFFLLEGLNIQTRVKFTRFLQFYLRFVCIKARSLKALIKWYW
jgi:hypothetical protein